MVTVYACTDCTFTNNPPPQYGVTHHPDTATHVTSVEVRAKFTTLAAAERYLAGLPKTVRARASGVSGLDDAGHYRDQLYACVAINVRFSPDGVNKGKNETGLKRLRTWLKVDAWQYNAEAYGNSATAAQFATFLETGAL